MLLIHPTAIVFAGNGNSRRGVIPWLDTAVASPAPALHPHATLSGPPAHSRYHAATELAAELILNGLRRVSSRQWPGWSQAFAETEGRGYHRMAAIMRQVQSASDAAIPASDMLKVLALARNAAA